MRRTPFLCAAPLAAAALLTAAAAEPPVGLPEFFVGGCTHFMQLKSDPAHNLAMMKQAGFNSFRDDAYWFVLEREKGKIDIPNRLTNYLAEAKKHALHPLIALSYGNAFYDDGSCPTSPEGIEAFARYCETVVKAAGRDVRLYQVWNEWDGDIGYPKQKKEDRTPENYVRLLAAVTPRVKAANPDAVVVANSVCTNDLWLEKTLRLGVMDHCDALSLHTYNFFHGYPGDTPEHWLRRMKKVRTMIRNCNNGKDKPLFITEMGYPNQIGSTGCAAETTAEKIVRIYLLAKTLPFIKGIWWYDFQDDGWDCRNREDNFGIVRPDLTPKPAYSALRSISGLLTRGRFLERVDTGRPDVWVLKFELDGKTVLAMWCSDPKQEAQLIWENPPNRLAPVELQFAGQLPFRREWGHREWARNLRRLKETALVPNQLSVTVGELPLLMTGDLADAALKTLNMIPFPRSAHSTGGSASRLPEDAVTATPAGGTLKFRNFGAESRYVKLDGRPYPGPSGLDAEFALAYTPDALHLTVAVRDDAFVQDMPIEEAWRGDGLQMAFQIPGKEVADQDRTEIDFAEIAGKPEVLIRVAQTGGAAGTPDFRPEIRHEGGTTVYRLTIPAEFLGIREFRSGTMFRFSLVVNDGDGAGRAGYLQWGRGIAAGKDPSLYGLAVCE